MVRVKKQPIRNDTTSPKKKEQRNQEYLKYKQYIRSKDFRKVKKFCEERDGGKCMVCGRTRKDGVNLTCHHRQYKHLYEGGSAEADDCITLCSICSKAIHSCKKNYSWFSMNNNRNKLNNEKC